MVKKLKKLLLSVFVIMVLSSLYCYTVNAKETGTTPILSEESVTVNTFTTKEITIENAGNYKFDYTITNNKNKNGNAYIKVDGDIYTDNSSNSAEVNIVGLRCSSSTDKPIVTVYYTDSDGNKISAGKIVVNVENNKIQSKFSNLKIGYNCMENVTFNYPYYGYDNGYTFKIGNEKIVKQSYEFFLENDGKAIFQRRVFTGLKKGSTTVKVYIGNVYVSKFTISVIDKMSKLTKKTTTLYYYKNAPTNFDIGKNLLKITDRECGVEYGIIQPYNIKAKYSFTSSNSKVAAVSGVNVIAKKTGTATLTVYEKLGKKVSKIGTVKIKVLTGKMSDVVESNRAWYDDGIFGYGEGTEYLSIQNKSTLDMKTVIEKCIINNKTLKTNFEPSEYKITYKIENEAVATVDENGIVTPVSEGDTSVIYTITFSDKSVFSEKFDICVEN